MQLQFVSSFIGCISAINTWALLFAVATPFLIACLLLIRSSIGTAAGAQLPPGSLRRWLPIVGETLEYATPNQSLLFMQRRVQKYGELFQSHLFGDRIIVSCSPKINHFICQHEHKLFKCSYPRSFVSILGEKNVSALPKDLHKKVRGALISTLASRLRTKECIKDVSTTIANTLQQWHGRVICVQEELAEMAYVVAAKRLLGLNEHNPECQTLMTLYFHLIKGLISIPINFPGMAFHNSMRLEDSSDFQQYSEKLGPSSVHTHSD